jgi:P4 family phage/plasmid primase-like protien
LQKLDLVPAELQTLVKRLEEAEIPLNRFFEVNADKSPHESKGYTERLRTPEEMVKAGITRWGIMGGNYLVPIDTDKPEMAEILRKIFPRTLESISVGRKQPHFYFLVWEKRGYKIPNKTLHIPGDYDEKGRLRGAGEIRVGNQYLIAPGTDVDYYNKEGEHVVGRYGILNDAPIAKIDYDDFMKTILPYLGDNAGEQKITYEEMRHGVPQGTRHAQGIKYANFLIGLKKLDYATALFEMREWNKLCTPPMDGGDIERMVKNAWEYVHANPRETKLPPYPTYEDFCGRDPVTKKLYPFQPATVAAWLAKHRHWKTDERTEILYYGDDERGVWSQDGETKLKAICAEILGDYNRVSHYNNIAHHLKGLTLQEITFSTKIACQNGLLDVETGEFSQFSLEEMPFYSINTTYNPEAKCPKWDAFLMEVLEKGDIPTLQEWSGFLLLPDYRFHKIMYEHGFGRNGKGVWERTVEDILGADSVCSVGLEEFDGNHRFAMRQLYGKLFNPCTEPTTNRVLQTALLKKATGQDTIDAECKGKDKRIKFRNCAKITIIANKFPRVEDSTTAFKERRLFVKFPNEFVGEKCKPNLESQWLKDPKQKSGILNWMLEGLKRLLKQGHFTTAKSQEETEIAFDRASDTIAAFLKEIAIFDKRYATSRNKAYDCYKNYCDQFGLEQESTQKFTQRLKETPKVSVTTVTIKEEGAKRLRGWNGIAFRKISDGGDIATTTDVSDVSDVSDFDMFHPQTNAPLEKYTGVKQPKSDTGDTVKCTA